MRRLMLRMLKVGSNQFYQVLAIILITTSSTLQLCWAGSAASLSFNGTTDVITCTSDASLDNLRPMTIAAWITPGGYGEGGLGRITDKDPGMILLVCDSTSACANAFDHTAKFVQRFSGNDGTWRFPDAMFGTADPNANWYHLAVTYDGSGGTGADPAFWFNGVSQAVNEQIAPTTTIDDDSAATLRIGNDSGATRTSDGTIAYVHIWNRTLTTQEIQENMQHPGFPANGLVMYQALTDQSGVDLSATQVNDCTFTGTTASASGPPVLGGYDTP